MATLSSRLAPLTVSVPAASEWVSFTPVWSNWTTNVTHTGRWRRVGDSIEMLMHATFSGVNTQGSVGTLTLPDSLTIDSSKFPTTTSSEKNYVVGNWEGMDTGVINTPSGTVFYRQDLNAFFLAYATGDLTATNVSTTANRPFTISNGDTFSIRVTLPITGWTSHTASATSANAVVVGGQSVGSALILGATSNQGFNILANNVAAISSTAAGAVTLGPASAIGGSTFPGASIVGRTNGSAISAGYVGEVRTFTQRITTGSTAAWVSNTSALDTLTPGVWLIWGTAAFSVNNAASIVIGAIAQNDSSASAAGNISIVSYGYNNVTTVANAVEITLQPRVVNISASTPFFAKSYSEDASVNVTINGFALRIA